MYKHHVNQKLIQKRAVILFLGITAYLATYGQEKAPEFITDRPDQTESAVVVPHKSLQVETGFLMENDKTTSFNNRTTAYNSTLLRYGLLPNFELRWGMEYLKEEQNTISARGLSPMSLGFKVAIAEEDTWKPELALLGALLLPFSAQSDLKPDYTGVSIRFSMAHTLSERVSLGYNLGVEWDGVSEVPLYFYTAALGFSLTNQCGIYAESFGYIPEEGAAEHSLDAGFTYLILSNLQFDISGGIGLNNPAPDNYFSIGLSYRWPH